MQYLPQTISPTSVQQPLHIQPNSPDTERNKTIFKPLSLYYNSAKQHQANIKKSSADGTEICGVTFRINARLVWLEHFWDWAAAANYKEIRLDPNGQVFLFL